MALRNVISYSIKSVSKLPLLLVTSDLFTRHFYPT